MQSRISLALCLLASTLTLSACGGSDNTNAPPLPIKSDVPVTLSDAVRVRGVAPDDTTTVFIFDMAKQQDQLDANKVSQVDGVDVRGSFNGWSKNTSFVMTKSQTDDGIWYLSLPSKLIAIPGNSGQPEFKFVVTGTVDGAAAKEAWLNMSSTTPEEYITGGGDRNHIVVFPGDNMEQINANRVIANTVKLLADFDLNNEEDKHKIANFRLVPGTSKLFRSYHPFKKSRSQYDTENTRVALVQHYMEQYGVKSVITLYKDETATLDASKNETISAYHQAIIDGGHNLYLPEADYNTVYFASDSAKFGGWIKQVVEFIISDSNQAPFEIHCRLGTDRTGVFSAVIASLMGASWNDIVSDYQSSNNMEIKEFRDYKLLKYSFEKMLQVDLDDSSVNLQQAMSQYLISNGYLTQAQIDALQAKLK
ncbi:MAG: tyrosine-protein phosphatase [Aeromonadaceae bacterium]